MGAYHAVIDEDALDFLADISNGDARAALTAVELGILTTERSGDGLIHITLSVASECIQKRVIRYDKTGDNHYDTISAFIKSMRGSDPDATAYYLARMLYAGEDVRFITARDHYAIASYASEVSEEALELWKNYESDKLSIVESLRGVNGYAFYPDVIAAKRQDLR